MPHYEIHHVIEYERGVVAEAAYYKTLSETDYVRVPTDGRAVLRLVDPNENELNLEALEYHHADLLAEIDDALHNSESLNEILEKLGQIVFKRSPFLNKEAEQEILNYINKMLPLEKPCHIQSQA